MPFPLDLTALGDPLTNLLFLTIGIGFGFLLEQTGFGRASKLAGQFYFTDFSMVKMMFTTVITGSTLIYGAAAIGLLDMRKVFIPSTYLWPIAVGAFILGVGFIIGGLCPGTSMAGVATFKIDAMAFLGGVFVGAFLFGETVPYFTEFWTTSNLGRLTVPEWLGVSTGWVILGVTLVALFLFWLSEQYEKQKMGVDPKTAPKGRYIGAGVLIALALGIIVIGDPGTKDYWSVVSAEQQQRLDNREVQIHPGELLAIMHDKGKNVIMLDVRDQRDYNQFHIRAARQVDPTLDAVTAVALDDLSDADGRTVVVAMSNGEDAATEAWKVLIANDVINSYILEGGINEWLEIFGEDADPRPVNYPDQLAFTFTSAIGGRCIASDPNQHEFEIEYEPKVKIAAAGAVVGGGCG